jgi:hypothetical protein
MQLRGHVAELADVELGDRPAERGADRANRGAGGEDLVHQRGPLFGAQVLQLARADKARQQHDPGVAGVGLQPRLAERQLAQQHGGGGKGGIEAEHRGHSAR